MVGTWRSFCGVVCYESGPRCGCRIGRYRRPPGEGRGRKGGTSPQSYQLSVMTAPGAVSGIQIGWTLVTVS